MRIGFDARMIGHPGIGRYMRSLLNAMLGLAGDCEFVLYGDRHKLVDFKNCDIREHTAPIYSWAEFFSSPFEEDKLDIVHIPHFNVPFQKKKKLVITIHDLIYLKFPESSPYLKRIAVNYAISRAVKKADKIIAVSENTKKDIIERSPDAEEKIEVVYEAAAPVFNRINDEGKKENVRKKYNLPKDIILFVGSLKKHKNIEKLIDAYTELKSKGVRHKLVIIGRYRPREAEIRKKIESTDALYLGEVPIEDLAAIYNLAALLVIPSLYEGFGLPAIEAMACGIPVAASSAASLPEVVGDAGILFDPYDTSDISNKICKVLKDGDLRQGLIRKGLERAAGFSWEKAAVKTLEIYKRL